MPEAPPGLAMNAARCLVRGEALMRCALSSAGVSAGGLDHVQVSGLCR